MLLLNFKYKDGVTEMYGCILIKGLIYKQKYGS